MKTCFTAVVLSFCACTVFGGESADGTKSVLAPTPAVVAAPAVATAAPVTACCAEGTSTTTCESRSSCRNRLFGGTVQRTRTVVREAVAVPVRVVRRGVSRSACDCK